MNKRVVVGFLGRVCLLEALLMAVPLLVGLLYREGLQTLLAFILPMGLLSLVGLVLIKLGPQKLRFTLTDGFVITALSWFLLSFFGCLPFYFSREIPSLVDALFEMASGFTTTGSSILTNVESLSQSMLFWRSFSHLIGGMGILVFAFALAPEMGEGSVNIMKAEVPGPEFGKLEAKNKNSAFLLYKIYLIMTAALIGLLMICGLNLFDACIHAFGAAGTGGFSNKAESVGAFHNPAAEYVLSISMIAFGVNFNLYFLLLRRRFRKFFQNEELRLYFLIIAIAVTLILLFIAPLFRSLEEAFRASLFTVSTIMTTTGYATSDFDLWPLFPRVILLGLMFIGAMAGSTAGGIKVSRILLYLKTFRRELWHTTHPRLVKPITIDGKRPSREYVRSVFVYLFIYIAIFVVGLFLITIQQDDFLTCFSAVAATFNNIGPGLSAVGPTQSFAAFSPFSKLVLTVLMIAGRLEIYPVLILFMPGTWSNRRKEF